MADEIDVDVGKVWDALDDFAEAFKTTIKVEGTVKSSGQPNSTTLCATKAFDRCQSKVLMSYSQSNEGLIWCPLGW